MQLIDQQIKQNDCGISAVKTVCNILNQKVNRRYIQENIFLDVQGSSLSDIKRFFTNNGYEAKYKLLDINTLPGKLGDFKELCPVITPVRRKEGLHYIVISGVKNNRLVVLDPAKVKEYTLSVPELKQIAYFSESALDYVEIDEQLNHLINQELSGYQIERAPSLSPEQTAEIFNKLTYFTYLRENFGFKGPEAEAAFLKDLLFNQELPFLPKHFQSIKLKKDRASIKSPLLLSVKLKEEGSPIPANQPAEQSVFLRLFNNIREIKGIWLIFISTTLVLSLISYLGVFINQILIDNILPSFQLNMVVLFAVGVGMFKMFELLIAQYRSFVAIHLGNLLDKYFLSMFDKKLNTYSVSYLASFTRGDLVERLSDSLKLKVFFLRFISTILVDVLVAVFSIFILFLINWQISIIIVGVLLLFGMSFQIITPQIKALESQRFRQKGNLFSKVMEKVDGLHVIRSFNIEAQTSHKIVTGIDELIRVQTKARYINLINSAATSLILIIASLLIIVLSSRALISFQAMTIGQIITCITLSGKIFSALHSLLEENLALQEHQVILKRFFDFEDSHKSVQSSTSSVPPLQPVSVNQITLREVSFGYRPAVYTLKNVNLTVTRGDKIQIEGENGSGKSTLCKILGLLYPPGSGSIMINDTDLAFYNEAALKKKVLLVSGDDAIFNDTLHFNLTFGRNIDTEKIIEYAKLIGFYDFISSHEEKLDYLLNEDGNNLSTGQKKKIIMLRAFLSDAEVLILDEMLSGIDMSSRVKIESLIDATPNRTFILVAHEPMEHISFNKKFRIVHGNLITS
jgi:ATP-binding cassette, subfamily B, bacterial HlyB/CyaB